MSYLLDNLGRKRFKLLMGWTLDTLDLNQNLWVLKLLDKGLGVMWKTLKLLINLSPMQRYSISIFSHECPHNVKYNAHGWQNPYLLQVKSDCLNFKCFPPFLGKGITLISLFISDFFPTQFLTYWLNKNLVKFILYFMQNPSSLFLLKCFWRLNLSQDKQVNLGKITIVAERKSCFLTHKLLKFAILTLKFYKWAIFVSWIKSLIQIVQNHFNELL